ncbi:hypothetical protein Ddye_014150 [Dipteronia dyeriana]|uniref:DUF4283 domain-containing protein n=1 Tax=Dipteronia dyeriana TaxID=168575 RepID=A0AAE0CKB5_9ROSI|nr:hypothetical protein Ddye_014150 [Dipteronia dyeriana]
MKVWTMPSMREKVLRVNLLFKLIQSKAANLDWYDRKRQHAIVQREKKEKTTTKANLVSDHPGLFDAMMVKEPNGREGDMEIGNDNKKKADKLVLDQLKMNCYENRRMETLYWDDSNCDSNWLNFSLVGVLKSFTDISSIIQGMLSKQIFFTFYYLGDKNVLWLFKSKKDMETFLHNRKLWEDFFSSVCAWSPAITPQARLVWVEFGGIPLDCWGEGLFRSLGWVVGETLFVEKKTLDKSTLANGRVLVLIPNGYWGDGNGTTSFRSGLANRNCRGGSDSEQEDGEEEERTSDNKIMPNCEKLKLVVDKVRKANEVVENEKKSLSIEATKRTSASGVNNVVSASTSIEEKSDSGSSTFERDNSACAYSTRMSFAHYGYSRSILAGALLNTLSAAPQVSN